MITTSALRPAAIALAVFLAGSPAIRANEAPALIAAALEAEKRHDPAAALELFRRAEQMQPDDAFIQQKIAKQLSDAAFLHPDEATRKSLVIEGLHHARRAVELAPESAVNRLSLAVLYGKVAVSSDVRTKVDYARRIRQHAEEALALDPNYAWACHVLGRWHIEMAALGGTRRALVALLFGGLPRASTDDGVRLLEQAVALEPAALAHRIELGFAYAQAGRHDDAAEQWHQGLAMPSVEIYDESAKQRARAAVSRS